MYTQISDAFIDKYGDKAGWAHQILFAGDLNSFKDKLQSPSKETVKEKNSKVEIQDPEKIIRSGKKRKISEITQPETNISQPSPAKEESKQLRKRRKL